jgi:signal transduction histidine kinase
MRSSGGRQGGDAVEETRDQLLVRNRELLALHEAGLAIAEAHNLEDVLQRVVDQARELVGARYGALILVRESGGIDRVITSGLSAEERDAMGPPTQDGGLWDVVLPGEGRLRLSDLADDPASRSSTANQPPRRSRLAVPVRARGRVLGVLCLTEKDGAEEFSADHENTLGRLATQAALAIENTRLHWELQAAAITEERDRLAREMHDGLAQILGYVNIKAQAAHELLAAGDTSGAAAQIDQLATAARSAYSDVREAVLALRTSLGPDDQVTDALATYLESWQAQNGIKVALAIDAPNRRPDNLSPVCKVQLLRIVQEALTNVRKHAAATEASIHIVEDNGWVEVSVQDNGRGFDPGAVGPSGRPRFGLATMRERAESVGGALSVESAIGHGTLVSARLPLPGAR